MREIRAPGIAIVVVSTLDPTASILLKITDHHRQIMLTLMDEPSDLTGKLLTLTAHKIKLDIAGDRANTVVVVHSLIPGGVLHHNKTNIRVVLPRIIELLQPNPHIGCESIQQRWSEVEAPIEIEQDPRLCATSRWVQRWRARRQMLGKPSSDVKDFAGESKMSAATRVWRNLMREDFGEEDGDQEEEEEDHGLNDRFLGANLG